MSVKKQQDKTVKTIQLRKFILLYSIASFLQPAYNKVINKVTDITQKEKTKQGGKNMNKLFKKVTATALAATMVLGMTACGGSKDTTTAESSSSAATETPAAATDNKDIKIGVSIWSSTDVLGSQCKLILDEAAKALGVQVQYVDQGHVSEKVTASVEQLVAAGCQGIIICNSSDTEMTSAIKTCNDNKVYLAQFFRVISKDNSADIYQMATDSAYYIGAVHEDEPANGEELVNILLEKGDRNIGLIGWEQGDATWLGRWEGYKAGVDKWNEMCIRDRPCGVMTIIISASARSVWRIRR